MSALERLRNKAKDELDLLDYAVLLGVFSDKEQRNEAAEQLEKMREIIVGQRKHIAEQGAELAFAQPRINALITVMDEWERFHPRAVKLLRKQKNFIVIADDEPYFIRAYGMIRKREYEKGTWTEEDEHLFKEAFMKRSGEKAEEPE